MLAITTATTWLHLTAFAVGCASGQYIHSAEQMSNSSYNPDDFMSTQIDMILLCLWLTAVDPSIKARICDGHQQKLELLLYFGSYTKGLTGLDGSPQGEQIQWHDLYISLLLLGYQPTLGHTHRNLTADYLDAFDIVITDYNGVNGAMDPVSLGKHKCKLRLLDS
jgi:hypothetical protein